MKVAVVDLGTNTCRLLLADAQQGRIECLEARLTTVVRLGQGVDAHGRLDPDAMRRTLTCLEDYAARIRTFAPRRSRLVATSALRDAADGLDFLGTIERAFALPWMVLSGDEEGRLTFLGATAGTPELHGTVAVIDIGGGSTEVCVGAARAQRSPSFVRSLDVGAVRLTERYFTHDPPLQEEWEAAMRFTRALLEGGVPGPLRTGVDSGIGVAGTITTLVAYELGLREYRREAVDGQELTLASIDRAIGHFRRMTSRERARLPGIQRGREDVILAGALIAREACRLFDLPALRCTEADIIEGAALELADESDF